MTGKERAEKRALANSLEPLFQIGKGGVTEAVCQQLEDVFNTHELIKIKIHLETCPISPKEVAIELSEKNRCEIIQVIGGVIILYRYNKKLHEPKKPKLHLPPPSKRHSIKERAAKKRRNASDRGIS